MPIDAFHEDFDYPITGYLHQVSDWANFSNGDRFELTPLGIYIPGQRYNKKSIRMTRSVSGGSFCILGSIDPATENVIDTSQWLDEETRYYSILMLQKTNITNNNDNFRILVAISNGLDNSNMDTSSFEIFREDGADRIKYRRGRGGSSPVFERTDFGVNTLNQPLQMVARVTRQDNTLVHECAVNPPTNENEVSWTSCGTTSFDPNGEDLRHDYILLGASTSAVAYLDDLDTVVIAESPESSPTLEALYEVSSWTLLDGGYDLPGPVTKYFDRPVSPSIAVARMVGSASVLSFERPSTVSLLLELPNSSENIDSNGEHTIGANIGRVYISSVVTEATLQVLAQNTTVDRYIAIVNEGSGVEISEDIFGNTRVPSQTVTLWCVPRSVTGITGLDPVIKVSELPIPNSGATLDIVSSSATISKKRTLFTGDTESQVLTLPAPVLDQEFSIRNAATVSVTIETDDEETIEGESSLLLANGEMVTLV